MTKTVRERSVTGIVLLAALLAAGCARCAAPDDEQAVRALLGEAVDAAERHELGDLLRLTTPGFVADPGGVSRQEVKGVLLMAFRRYGRFTIRHPRPAVALGEDGRTAEADLPFLIVREGARAPDLGGLLDDPEGFVEAVAGMGDAYFLELRIEKTDDGWRAARARIRGTRGRWSP
jgi:hypothetical protein